MTSPIYPFLLRDFIIFLRVPCQAGKITTVSAKICLRSCKTLCLGRLVIQGEWSERSDGEPIDRCSSGGYTLRSLDPDLIW
jgi:hypothetical protein